MVQTPRKYNNKSRPPHKTILEKNKRARRSALVPRTNVTRYDTKLEHTIARLHRLHSWPNETVCYISCLCPLSYGQQTRPLSWYPSQCMTTTNNNPMA